jgi:hypothetical protein
MGEEAWEVEFAKYRASPEYAKVAPEDVSSACLLPTCLFVCVNSNTIVNKNSAERKFVKGCTTVCVCVCEFESMCDCIRKLLSTPRLGLKTSVYLRLYMPIRVNSNTTVTPLNHLGNTTSTQL